MQAEWSNFGRHRRFEDDVTEAFDGFDDDLEVARLARLWRDTINANLAETGITLHGSSFYFDEPVPADWRSRIEQAIAEVDVNDLLKRFAEEEGRNG